MAELLQNIIIRNRLKVGAAIVNAQRVLDIGSLYSFIWNHTDGKPFATGWNGQRRVHEGNLH
ncbi:MAG: DNA-3-methyladenine glycosylase I [Clostridiales bacterium]|nr:DNA-3-methyladenine glycosylase I [Clostridiales bacterium]